MWTPKHGPSALRALVGNEIFGATFTKADGTERTGTFRLGVSSGVTGQGQAYDPDERGNLIVYDMAKQAYRTIKIERLKSVRFAGQEIDCTNPFETEGT